MIRSRALRLALIWTLPAVILVAITAAVQARYRLDTPPRLSGDARADVLRVLRAAVDGAAIPAPSHPELSRALDDRGPLSVTLFLDGRRVARADGSGATIAEATRAAAAALAGHAEITGLAAADRARARLKVDLVVARGELGGSRWLFDWLAFEGLGELVPLNPGLDGIGVTLHVAGAAPREIVVAPDDLVESNLLTKRQPISVIPDWSLGLDRDLADAMLARRAARPPGGWGAATRHYWRFRADSFVERPLAERGDGPPLPLERGLPPGPEVSAASLRAGALAGARYLVAQIAPSGRYVYERHLASGRASDPSVPGPYSIPRHAGTTYFLAEAYRITGEEFLREPIERAFGHLQELILAGGCVRPGADGARMACVIDRGDVTAALGSTALTVVALVEYQRATKDTRYLELARDLTAWILFMQRPDGSFAHQYDVASGVRDEKTQLFYYSGEAALALARMHLVTGDARYADAAERALDWLVDWYDFFLGGFLYGEEHWTCIAAEALFPARTKVKYRQFCDGYGAFLRAQQPEPGDHPDQDDLAGAYGLTPFVMPYNTPAGSRTEAMISAYLLGRHQGAPDERIREQILAALHYVLRQQIRPESDWNVPLAVGQGAVPASPIERNVRIDFVQHVCSAMIRAVELVEPTPR